MGSQKKLKLCAFVLSMYDQDGNGWIDLVEMTRIVKSIYSMMGPEQVELQLLWKNMSITQVKASVEEQQSPEERAQGIFTRMDINSDGKVTRQEFVQACIMDKKLVDLLSPQFQT